MSGENGLLPGRYPAIVQSYDQARRTCRVQIPGITDGGDVMPEAEIEYAIGDKAREGQWATEIEILPGDTVWVAFIGGDPRYPVITGWRNPQTGNSADWRRWHHKNIELEAEEVIHEFVKTTDYRMDTQSITSKADSLIKDTVGSSTREMKPKSISDTASQSITITVGGSTIKLSPTNIDLNASAMIKLSVGGTSIVITAAGLSMAGGGSTVSADSSGVSLNGPQIKLN